MMSSGTIAPLSFALLALVSCAGGPRSASSPEGQAASSSRPSLRTSAQVSQALEEAQAAYLDGRWGDAVLKATAVIEGAASPEDYYMAVKILGMASCSRRDPRPVAFAWKRLEPADRDSLRNACAANGMTISDSGVVTPTR